MVESVGLQEGSHVWQALQRQLLELLLPTYSYLRNGGLKSEEGSYLEDWKMVTLPADTSRQPQGKFTHRRGP